jgi:hypothetical protein
MIEEERPKTALQSCPPKRNSLGGVAMAYRVVSLISLVAIFAAADITQAAEILIDNGLAPPNPENIIDDGTLVGAGRTPLTDVDSRPRPLCETKGR